MNEPKDKRTKEYRDWNAKQPALKPEAKSKYTVNPNPSIGLGDTVEKITKATGIKKAVEWIAGKDCGCDKRKKWLNEKFRYKNPECMQESEYEFWTDYLKRHNPKEFSKRDVYEIDRLYRRLFRLRISICANCNSAVKTLNGAVDAINTVYSSYEIK